MTIANWIEVAIYLVIIGAFAPFTAFALSYFDLFWTRLESGTIKFLLRGGTVVKIIADVRGKRIEGHKLVDAGEERNWWERVFGIYWIGVPPFASLLKFKIPLRKEHEDLEGRPSAEWIQDLGTREVDALRAAFPRPLLLGKVELGDRQAIDLLIVGKFEVVDAWTPVVELKGSFFELLGSILRGAIVDIVERHATMDLWIEANKGEGGILKELVADTKGSLSPFNQILVTQVGLKMVGATIPQWDPSDPRIRDAMNAKFVAEKEKEATIINADAYAEKVNRQTTADAARVERMATARGKQIRETVAGLASSLGNRDVVAQGAADILEMEAATSPDSKLTTLVKGPGATPVVPVGGGDKK